MLVFTHSLSQSPTLCAILIPSAWCHLLPGKTKRDPAPATGAPAHPSPGKEPPWSLASLQQNKSFFLLLFFLIFFPKEKATFSHLAQQGTLCLPFVARAENRSDGTWSQPATSRAPHRCWTSICGGRGWRVRRDGFDRGEKDLVMQRVMKRDQNSNEKIQKRSKV